MGVRAVRPNSAVAATSLSGAQLLFGLPPTRPPRPAANVMIARTAGRFWLDSASAALSDRTMLGSHAPTHDPQPGLQNVPAIQESNSEIPETHNSQELEPPLRSNHRQLPRHPPRQVSGRRLAAVYQEAYS